MNNIKELQQELSAVREKIDLLKQAIRPTEVKIRDLETRKDDLKKSIEMLYKGAESNTVELFENNGADDIYVDEDGTDGEWQVFEDDGTLHIVFGHIRGCFIGDQDMRGREWNSQAKKIMAAVGVPAEMRKDGLI